MFQADLFLSSLDNVGVVGPRDDGHDEDDWQPLGRVHAPVARTRPPTLPDATTAVVGSHGHRHSRKATPPLHSHRIRVVL